MVTQKTKTYLSVAGLFYATLLLGVHYVITRALVQTTDALTITGYRFLIAAVPLFLYLLYVRKNPFRNMKPGLILGFFLGLTFIFIAEGVSYTSASNAGFISGAFIMFVPIFSYWFFRTKPTIYLAPVVGLSLLGLYFSTGQLERLNAGDIFIVLSAVFTAVHLVLMSHYAKQDLDVTVLCFQQFLTVFVMSFVLALVMGKSIFVPAVQTAPLLFLGVFATLSVFFVQMASLRYVSVVTGAIILTFRPAFTAAFAVFWGGESITLIQMFGGALLIAAVLVNQLSPNFLKSRRPREETV
jgi:drug/metabolite transporter (DMT)-like permease